MTPKQQRSLTRLMQGLQHADNYDPPLGDDTPLFACDDDSTLFELAAEDGQLRIGDLRTIGGYLQELGVLP